VVHADAICKIRLIFCLLGLSGFRAAFAKWTALPRRYGATFSFNLPPAAPIAWRFVIVVHRLRDLSLHNQLNSQGGVFYPGVDFLFFLI
jgi:hypothetical protein